MIGGTCDTRSPQVADEAHLEALADSGHEEHEAFMAWNGPFDSEDFDAEEATKGMRRGLSDWREME